jgi:hypothetical protein
MHDSDDQQRRILAVVGDDGDVAVGAQRWFTHLNARLEFPCEVIAKEDFRWEEPYLLGIGPESEYLRLRQQQPSFQDVYSMEGLEMTAGNSTWALRTDDIGARVRRAEDGKTFVLGLSELAILDADAANAPLLDDYSMWFCNSR